MSEEDKELEILKAKRLAEMQKNLSNQEKQEDETTNDVSKPQKSSRDYVLDKLGYRGLEVLETAEFQFPSQTKIVIDKLGELISTSEINETLDGGKLLTLFRSVGINVRLDNKINVEKDGKFVSITDKFKDKSETSNDE